MMYMERTTMLFLYPPVPSSNEAFLKSYLGLDNFDSEIVQELGIPKKVNFFQSIFRMKYKVCVKRTLNYAMHDDVLCKTREVSNSLLQF